MGHLSEKAPSFLNLTTSFVPQPNHHLTEVRWRIAETSEQTWALAQWPSALTAELDNTRDAKSSVNDVHNENL